MFLKSLSLQDQAFPDGYPFTVPAIECLDQLSFDTPVTFFVGENGCGKSTLIEAIACGLKCPTIGATDVRHDPLLADARALASHMRLSRTASARTKLFFRAEDAIGFTRQVSSNLADLETLEKDFDESLSGYGRQLATGAIRGQRQGLTSRYGDNPDALSHGEWFINMIKQRVHGKGLYLLDEPETPLSPIHQLSLLSLIKEAVEQGAQFIIATHSPILMAHPGATIYSLDHLPIKSVAWDEVEHVEILRAFLADPMSFLRHL